MMQMFSVSSFLDRGGHAHTEVCDQNASPRGLDRAIAIVG
jgi:hypothetical protein